MNIDKKSLARIGIGIVILHVVITFVHAIAHTNLYIAMSLLQNVYIFLVILAGPIFAAVYLRKNPPVGFAVLAVSMLGSFLFGVYYHFIAISSDNVLTLDDRPWTMTFQLTAVLLAIVEFAGTGLGLAGFLGQD
jgi:hypothetical protein